MNRSWCIIKEDGTHVVIQACSLRTALRQAGIDEEESKILAAVETGCIPRPPDAESPFYAVIMRNPAFAAPPHPWDEQNEEADDDDA